MQSTLSDSSRTSIIEALHAANTALLARYPGESGRRQPVHTLYGGAHLFRADSAQKLGGVALRMLDAYAPNFASFAKVLGLPGVSSLPGLPRAIEVLASQIAADPVGARQNEPTAWLAHAIYTRVREKLAREPIEDFRIDFEDGYGNRPDAEEDGHAVSAANEVARGLTDGSLPPFVGIRIKPFSEELKRRSIRTLDIFLSTLLAETGGKLPDNFVVTLPKVMACEHVAALAELLEMLEGPLTLPAGTLKLELMIETPQSIIGEDGQVSPLRLVNAARGRCVAAHFGTYDYTALCSITAAHQSHTHPACDFARHVLQVSLANTGIWLSDGATNIMPVAPHRAAKQGPPLTDEQSEENSEVVHRAWRLHYEHIQHSLVHGYYQGWDLHPGQFCTRYAAVYSFFLSGLRAASERLRNFIEVAAQATLVGDVFDDAATGQGLLNFFLRAINCGAVLEAEAVELSGLTVDELHSRSFVKILQNRRGS